MNCVANWLAVKYLASLSVTVACNAAQPQTGLAREIRQADASERITDEGKKPVRFSFSRAPWKDVLQWLAQSAGLSLYVGELPSGTFTYVDSRAYTPDEAIDRINLFLIPQRYVLTHSKDLLAVIALDDEAGVRQLDAMAELVSVDQLGQRGDRELIKCFFPLGSLTLEQVTQELGGLMLIREPVVLRNTNQLLVTDTAGKLRTVQQILAALSETPGGAGAVRRFSLGDLDPEKVLSQIRPHVGVEPLAMTAPDVSFSVDPIGACLLVSGSKEKLSTVENVMKMLQSMPSQSGNRPPRHFRSHPVGSANMETVVNVLQTLLADEDVRLAADAKSNQIALMASVDVHALVHKTIDQLSDSDAVEFKAISINSLDPLYVATLLNSLFGASDGDDAKGAADRRPRVDFDAVSGRLLVRAKASQIAQIERVLDELAGRARTNDTIMRVLPYTGERARRILEGARQFWPNNLIILPSSNDIPSEQTQELEITPTSEPREAAGSVPPGRLPTGSNASGTDATKSCGDPFEANATAHSDQEPRRSSVRAQLTPHGIVIQSDNVVELDQFERLVRTIGGPLGASRNRLAVYYLKHSTASEADRLLRKWLDTKSEPIANSASGSKLVRSAAAWNYGTATIFADNRLNRLFVYGGPEELNDVERHLKVIDRENSITDVRTHGTPRFIALRHARAEDVAAVMRDIYADRVAPNAEDKKQAVQQALRQAQEAPARGQEPLPARALSQSGSSDSRESPRMTLATDSNSNAIIVTAPSQLADEVERLALAVDRQSEKTVQVMVTRGTHASQIQTAIKNLGN
jgi:type II secretory pathway component GspD/PulD (secretin)